MKKNKTKKALAGSIITALPLIVSTSCTSATVTNDYQQNQGNVGATSTPVSFYADFQSLEPLDLGQATCYDSTGNYQLNLNGKADLSVGLRITNASVFNNAFNASSDVSLSTLISGLACIDNNIDIVLKPRNSSGVVLSYNSSTGGYNVVRQWIYTVAQNLWLQDRLRLGEIFNINWYLDSAKPYQTPIVGYLGEVSVSIPARTTNAFTINVPDIVRYTDGADHSDIGVGKPMYTYYEYLWCEDAAFTYSSRSTYYIGFKVVLFDTINFSLVQADSPGSIVPSNWEQMIKIRKLSDKTYYAYLSSDVALKLSIATRAFGTVSDSITGASYDSTLYSNTYDSTPISLLNYVR